MNFLTANYDTRGEIFASIYAYFCIFMILVVLPITNIWIQFKNYEYLMSDNIRELFGALYLDNKFKKPL